MAKSRRAYKGAAVSNTLASGGITISDTSIPLASAMSGWASDGTPFFVVIDPGTAKEEKVCVKYNTSTNLTVVDPAVTSSWTSSVNGRGVDDTTAFAHAAGAVIYPVFTALEANQANEVVSKYTTNGDIVVHGSSSVKTISTGGSGGNNKVLIADSTVTDGGVKWGLVTADNLDTGAVTSGKILDGTIVNADINASAAIALSKLATGALPTAITVTTGNLIDDSVTSDKIAAPTLTSKTDSFTLALVDENCTMQCNKATALTVTVPTSSVAFTTGAVVTLMQYGAGQVTVAGDTGVTVRSANGLKLRTQYSMATLVKISNTEWVLSGDTVVS